MRIVDANVLLYAVNTDARHHEESRAWLDEALSGGDRVGLAWMPLVAFIRLSTRPGLFAAPLSPESAAQQVQAWTTAPSAVIVQPTDRHAAILCELLTEVGTGGNLTNDAHLAALALEHRADLVTFDTDFDLFPRVRWSRPGALR